MSCRFHKYLEALLWRHNGRDDVSNHQPPDCLLNHLSRRRSKKTAKLLVTGICVGNSPVTGEFPTQMASTAEKYSIWWRHHAGNIYWAAHIAAVECRRTVHAESYIGTIHWTSESDECVPWSSWDLTWRKFPDSSPEQTANHCRNPMRDLTFTTPLCRVAHFPHYEACDIPFCGMIDISA